MSISNIANAIDTEWDGDKLLEVGITTIDLKNRKILSKYSMPIKYTETYGEEDITHYIKELTGWTKSKLDRQGISLEELCRRLFVKMGASHRITIVDSHKELPAIDNAIFNNLFHLASDGYVNIPSMSTNTVNVSTLFSIYKKSNINLSLAHMMAHYDLEFEGNMHNAMWDSYNIARLFIAIIEDEK